MTNVYEIKISPTQFVGHPIQTLLVLAGGIKQAELKARKFIMAENKNEKSELYKYGRFDIVSIFNLGEVDVM